MLQSIRIYNTKKLHKIMDLLKKDGRIGCYDIFYYDVNRIYYVVWYKAREVQA